MILGITASQRNKFTGLLDDYPNADVAYSLRKLRAAYTGSAIRVRRSSDNAEQDIGFDGSGNLDTSSLSTFVGANNGFVTTWYDQSGNANNATQSTAANQPAIVLSGSVQTQNTKPSILLDGTNDSLLMSISNNTNTVSFFGVVNKTAAGTSASNANSRVLGLAAVGENDYSTANGFAVGYSRTGLTLYTYRNNAFLNTQGISFNNLHLVTSINNGTDSVLKVNANSDLSVANSANFNYTRGAIGVVLRTFGVGNADYLNGYVSECIIYHSSKYSERASIQSNINDYYAIY